MDFLNITFPVSGVTTNILFPPLVAMIISFFTSMGGISGAFLLLPFQMSVLNYTAPSVSGTNHVFNMVAIPSGVYRYFKEGRMVWPLAWIIIGGTLPGVFLGYYLRVWYLPDPKTFKLFVGCVLLYTGIRLFRSVFSRKVNTSDAQSAATNEKGKQRDAVNALTVTGGTIIKTIHVSLNRVEYEFQGERFSFPTLGMMTLAFVVGIIGGAYGIGGGSIIAPFCIAFFHLPVYTIAGATLLATFATSVAGAFFFSVIPATGGISAMPDWLLGILFGIGGFVGMYLGARVQKFVPQKFIKLILSIAIVFLAAQYIIQYVR